MVFSSLEFLLYFLPITFIGYFILSFSVTLQNIWLLIVSIFFYAWGEPVYVIVLIISILINYISGLIIGVSQNRKEKAAKVVVILAVVINLGILFAFKYLGFFVEIINSAAGTTFLPVPEIVLPIGISFYTFQAMSYVIDVYRKDSKVQKNLFYLGLYVVFFPQLVAGPIVRYNTIEEYIHHRKFSLNQLTAGITRFAVGMVKKILLSNNLAIVVDTVYDLVETGNDLYSTSLVMAWIGAVFYMLQIYYDFSGYSDMAIGLGKMFGFEFEENFNYPYISKSIGEFWRRWHISLGTWFKEYVYFPLGGSRVKNKDVMVRNTAVVWILTGLWHGASWNFILWGVYNLFFILLERITGFEKSKVPNSIKYIYSNFIVLIGWVIFRAENLYILSEMVSNMFLLNNNHFCDSTAIMILKEYWMVLIPAIVFSMPIAPYLRKRLIEKQKWFISVPLRIIYISLLAIFFVVCFITTIRGGYNPFIYFNF